MQTASTTKRERVLPGARVELGQNESDVEKVELRQTVTRVWSGGLMPCF